MPERSGTPTKFHSASVRTSTSAAFESSFSAAQASVALTSGTVPWGMAAALQDSAAEWGVPDGWAMRPAELCGPAPRSGAVRNKIEVFSMSDAVYFWFPSTRIVKETAVPSDQNPEMTFNDPDFPNQSYLGPNGVNLTPLYDTYRGTGVRIGVVDTGIDYTDVELAGQVDTAAGWDGLQGDSD